mmetsp:Transcript_3482/g.8214  ORF Transcript_3482/g.8214 Transcript_3482/m.8214 type:complete len:526 (+) Transcript_3482:2898-4475(+)
MLLRLQHHGRGQVAIQVLRAGLRHPGELALRPRAHDGARQPLLDLRLPADGLLHLAAAVHARGLGVERVWQNHDWVRAPPLRHRLHAARLHDFGAADGQVRLDGIDAGHGESRVELVPPRVRPLRLRLLHVRGVPRARTAHERHKPSLARQFLVAPRLRPTWIRCVGAELQQLRKQYVGQELRAGRKWSVDLEELQGRQGRVGPGSRAPRQLAVGPVSIQGRRRRAVRGRLLPPRQQLQRSRLRPGRVHFLRPRLLPARRESLPAAGERVRKCALPVRPLEPGQHAFRTRLHAHRLEGVRLRPAEGRQRREVLPDRVPLRGLELVDPPEEQGGQRPLRAELHDDGQQPVAAAVREAGIQRVARGNGARVHAGPDLRDGRDDPRKQPQSAQHVPHGLAAFRARRGQARLQSLRAHLHARRQRDVRLRGRARPAEDLRDGPTDARERSVRPRHGERARSPERVRLPVDRQQSFSAGVHAIRQLCVDLRHVEELWLLQLDVRRQLPHAELLGLPAQLPAGRHEVRQRV